MSRDFALGWNCPHLTYEERLTLPSDRRTLQTAQSIASSNTVRLTANDIAIPQSGLFSVAQLFASVGGPFDLTPLTKDLTVETSQGSWGISLPVASRTRLTTEQVLRELRGRGTFLAENVNGHLSISDTSQVGPESFVKVSGSAVAALGFGSSSNGRCYGARGQKILPAWDILAYSRQIRDITITDKYPRFREPVLSNPLLKISYATSRDRCLRCGGTNVENDFRYDASGQDILIENESLLQQIVLKMLLTERGSNFFHRQYGSIVKSVVGTKVLAGTAALLSEDVRRALSLVQNVQRQQAVVQQVSPRERLYSILSVNVMQHEKDPTVFLIDITVQNASAEPINIPVVFTVPGVTAQAGTNGQSLGVL
jgi:hypothetical protein